MYLFYNAYFDFEDVEHNTKYNVQGENLFVYQLLICIQEWITDMIIVSVCSTTENISFDEVIKWNDKENIPCWKSTTIKNML